MFLRICILFFGIYVLLVRHKIVCSRKNGENKHNKAGSDGYGGILYHKIAEEEKKSWEAMTLEEHMAVYENQGIDRKEAMKLVAKDRGISKRDVYQALL